MYIEPPFQLPEQAESLHIIDWKAAGEEFARGIALFANALVEAFTPTVRAIGEIIEATVDVFVDATRDNAYHPQGPVIRSTGFGLPDDMPSPDQRLLK